MTTTWKQHVEPYLTLETVKTYLADAKHKTGRRATAIPDQDRCERGALQVEQALSEGGSRGLHAALVGGVDLEVMAVGGVQAQETVASRAIAWVHHCSEQLAQIFGLQSNSLDEEVWECWCSSCIQGHVQITASEQLAEILGL